VCADSIASLLFCVGLERDKSHPLARVVRGVCDLAVVVVVRSCGAV
jgi:hypothetical protein